VLTGVKSDHWASHSEVRPSQAFASGGERNQLTNFLYRREIRPSGRAPGTE